MKSGRQRSLKHIRIEQLKNRLRESAGEYAPFFAEAAASSLYSLTVLCGVQHLRRSKSLTLSAHAD